MAYKSTVEGGEVVLLQLVRGLKSLGADVHVCAPSSGELLRQLDNDGFRTAVIAADHLYSFNGMKQLKNYWETNKIDLVQTHGKMPNIIARMARRGAAIPKLVSTEHCLLRLAHGGNSSSIKDRLKSAVYREIDCFTSRYSDRIVCVSESVRQDKLEQGIAADKLTVIANGVALSDFDPPESPQHNALRSSIRKKWDISEDTPVIGSVCRLDKNKNVAALIEMMPFVWEVLPEARLVVIGDGPEHSMLASRIADLKYPEKVLLTGYCKNVPELLTGFDIAAFSSSSEGFGLALVEAMASGIPVVTTAVPAVSDFGPCGEGVRIVVEASSPLLAKECLSLLTSTSSLESASRAVLSYVKDHFSSERMVKETVQLYNELGFSL